ncbi:MAG: PrgI family protein [Clostridia bacterium]|nr:PrgI family protein [Clostridia bacterium]
MQVFKVPYDMKREEKIFGGYLSLRQVSYLLLATVPLALFPTGLPLIIKLLLVSTISTFFVLCCFLKIGEQNFDKFFFFAIKYLFRKKVYVYSRRCN